MRSPLADPGGQPRSAEAAMAEESGEKVLERLALFSDQRGFAVNAPIVESAPQPAGAPRDATGGEPEPGLTLSREDVTEEAAGAFATQDIAEVYIDAARALETAPPQVRSAPEGTAPSETRAAAIPAWRLVGPLRIPNGQTYGASRVDVAGRVSSVAVDPTNANHILCGSAGGGVWETRDGGGSWAPRTDRLPTLATGAIAFDPRSPNVVYAGTGEGNFYAGLGAGLLRSANGGTTWTVHASAPFVGSGFHDLIVDPANSGNLLAATTSGLYTSSDSGATWTRRRSARVWSLSMHPAGGASAEVLAACSDGLHRSTDGGQTWTLVTLPGAPASWNRLAVDHARSTPAVAFAFGAAGGSAYLYRRDAAGTWQRLATPGDLNIGQAWYDWFVAAAPDRDTQVYLGAIEVHRGDLSGTTWTWTTLSAKPSGDSIHPDQHAIAFHPTDPNTIFVGNDGGLYRSPNRGINWQALNTGLAIAEIEYIAHDPGSARWLMGGTQDNGTIRYPGRVVWDHIADGDGGDCSVNTLNPDTIFHSFFRMGLERSNDRGQTWRWIPTASRDPNVYRQLFYPPAEGRGNTIAQAGESVFISRNNGDSLTEITLPGRPVASAMYLPTPDLVFVGTTNGRIFRISWTGTAWSAATELTSPRSNAWVSDLFVDPTNTNRIWATFTTIGGGRVFHSTNGGSSWTDRSAGLPSLPINAVEVDPRNSNRIWVAADVGVYQSFNAGSSWSAFSNGLPNMLVVDLVYQPHARLLRAGTRNRGVWEIAVDGELAQPICGRQWTGTLNGNSSQRWFTFNWPATWHVIWTVMPTTVQSGAPQITWDVQIERANAEYVTYWISVTNLTPTPVTFEGRYCILSYY
ncbi:MAG: hypothetical protein M3173_01850 [Chloroflexota bacterium]|nr:hypothetical protein [Chloroflexota bacterium]